MWVYEITNAFGPPAAAASTTATSGTTGASEYNLGTVGGVSYYGTASTAISSAFDRWGTSATTRVFSSVSAITVGAVWESSGVSYETNTATGSTLQSTQFSEGAFGFTGSGSTAVGGFATTFSGGTTAAVSRSSRATGTTTHTGTAGAETTTTSATTASAVTTAAGPTTTTTSLAATETISTAAGGTVTTTATSYLYAPSTTITAPDSWISVSEAAASEHAWEITATADTAGYLSQLGASFTRREGLFYPETSVLPVTGAPPVRTMVWSITTATAATSYVSTLLTTTLDTFKPAGDLYPITATSTRAADLLTTASTAGPLQFLFSEVTQTILGDYPGSIMADSTLRTTVTVTAPLTYNVNPTSTVAGSFHITHVTSTAIRFFRYPPHYATSVVSTANTASSSTATDSVTFSIASTFTDTGTHTFDTTTATTETVTTTASGSYTVADPYIATLTSTVFNGGTSYTEACGVAAATVTGSYQQTIGGTTESIYSTITHAAPADHTISEETYAAYTTTANATSTATVTTTASGTSAGDTITGTNVTETTSATSTASVEDFSTLVATFATAITEIVNQSQGISLTWPALAPQLTYNFSTPWTVHAFHPRPGFSVYESSGLFSGLSLAGGGSLFYPFRATQLDSAGPAMPLLFVGATTYANGASHYTASVGSAPAGLSYTMAATATSTATAALGTVSSTYTVTTTTASASGTASFVGEDAATWHAPQSSAGVAGSRVGGQAARSTYGLVAYYPPGVRHYTTQTVDTAGIATTGSATTWLAALSTRSASAEAHALPLSSESVFSVSLQETYFDVGSVFSLTPRSQGATAAPVITVSKFPNL